MNHLWNLVRKELKELLTPASIIPIIAIAVIFASMGTMIGSEVDRASEAPTIGILSGDSGVYYDDAVGYIEDFYINALGVADPSERITILDPALYTVITGGNANAVRDTMEEAGVNILLVFDSEYSNNITNIAGGGAPWKQGTIYVYWNDVEMGLFGSVSTAVVAQMIAYVNTMTAKVIIEDLGGAADPIYIQFPVAGPANRTVFNGEIFDDITPADISGALQSQSMLMPILIMVIITMIGGMIISSMGNEKENKTLETLLTLPVKRTTIVSGKLIGSAIAGLLFGLVYLFGMYMYTNSLAQGTGALSLSSLGLTLSVADWGVVALVIFLGIMCALGMCMVLGAFVKNYKAAQTLTLPIGVLAMIPMFVTMFSDFSTLPQFVQVALFAIPFTHPMMIMNNLMLGNTFMIYAGLGYLLLFSTLMIYITVRIYKSDILLTGLVKKERRSKAGSK
ncbi:MAG: ABC transporter permease [Methanomassiliicoccaceae archaeon]|nr:ABC transporter permease [Methanomassiliicoccaceae archaeon]